MDTQPAFVAIPEQFANLVGNLVGCLVEHEGVVGVLNFQIPILLQHPARARFSRLCSSMAQPRTGRSDMEKPPQIGFQNEYQRAEM